MTVATGDVKSCRIAPGRGTKRAIRLANEPHPVRRDGSGRRDFGAQETAAQERAVMADRPQVGAA
ncbi:MAG: hypothetical protein HIU82_21050 [Proteobacteria bacterium]|nr:hypothetical protein [Pseudomonadota bacterium]